MQKCKICKSTITRWTIIAIVSLIAQLTSLHVVITNAISNQNNLATPTDNDRIHFISNGSYLIESNGHYGLVDALYPLSPSNENDNTTCYGIANCAQNEWETVKYVVDYLKSLGIKSLDFIVGSHSHSDHIGGMPLIAQNFVNSNTKYYYREYQETIEEIMYTGEKDWYNKLYYTRALDTMARAGATLEEITNKYPSFQLGDFNIEIMNTEPAAEEELSSSGNLIKGENKNSIATLITYDSKKVLLTTDLEFEDEPKIANKVGKIDLLQMGHHGLSSSTGIEFIEALQPKDIIIPNTFNEYLSFSPLYYADRQWDTNIYTTKDTIKHIIIATFKNNSYTLHNTTNGPVESKIQISEAETDGICKKIKFYNQQTELLVRLYADKHNRPIVGWKEVNCWGEGKKNVYLDHGNLVIGWREIELNNIKSWFYFDKNGYMVTGWQKLNWNGKTNWYYFDESGRMITGWRRLNWNGKTNWYYFNKGGNMVTGWQRLNWNGQTNWYYFNDGGHMVTGWQKINWNDQTNWYYFDESGRMITGWRKLNWNSKDSWFYFDKSGKMIHDQTITLNGSKYSFNHSGICIVGNGCN